jgi:FkbM family methyltransferase
VSDIAALIARAQADLAEAEAALVARLGPERTRARADLVRRLHEVRRMREPAYLYPSQAGQDAVVDRLLGGKTGGVFVDVGGYDGVTGSNTLFFEQFRGWSGLLVEPVPANFARAAALRRCACLPCAVADQDGTAELIVVDRGYIQMSGLARSYDQGLLGRVRADPRHAERSLTVETRRLDRIMDEAGIAAADFVSLDIEGGEVAVLTGFPFARIRVAVWAIENNTGDGAIGAVMRANGYVLAEFCGPDEIWRLRDLSPGSGP